MARSGPDAVRAVMGEARCLLLDFDGPVCDIFEGLPGAVLVVNAARTGSGACRGWRGGAADRG